MIYQVISTTTRLKQQFSSVSFYKYNMNMVKEINTVAVNKPVKAKSFLGLSCMIF